MRQEFPEVSFLWSLKWIAWVLLFPQMPDGEMLTTDGRRILCADSCLAQCRSHVLKSAFQLRVTGCFKWSKWIWDSNLIFKCSVFHDCNTQFSGCVNDDYIHSGQSSKKGSKKNTHGEWRMCGEKKINILQQESTNIIGGKAIFQTC